jgi:RNA recognition motif-containing protein
VCFKEASSASQAVEKMNK